MKEVHRWLVVEANASKGFVVETIFAYGKLI
jgi:hypothetical protein